MKYPFFFCIFADMLKPNDLKTTTEAADIHSPNGCHYSSDADFDFESIYLNSYRGLCAYACRYVDISTAEEIVQDTMMWLWDNRQTIIPGKSVGALLLRIVHNKAINQIKHRTVFTKVHKQIELNLREQFENPDMYLSVELSEMLERALTKLPENLREVFILSRVERLSYKEIAERLNINIKAVDNRLSRTMKILREELKDYLPLLLLLLELSHKS